MGILSQPKTANVSTRLKDCKRLQYGQDAMTWKWEHDSQVLGLPAILDSLLHDQNEEAVATR
jgi:hypothetical protein